jgi:adenylate cyclase class IV
MTSALPKQMRTPLPRATIEVERKFNLPSGKDLSDRVTALGGEVKGKVQFTDSYWDTAGCTLTRRDVWLRQRDGAWELKLPVEEEDARRSGGERSVFHEIETPHAVGIALT